MSIARHHAEWLSLVEVSGPFLSMPVLLEAFPQGLEAHDPDPHRLLRLAHDEWEAEASCPATHNFPFLEGRKRDTSWRTTEATPLPVNNREALSAQRYRHAQAR